MTVAPYTPETEPPATVAAQWRRRLPGGLDVGVARPATGEHRIQCVAKARADRLARHTACFSVVRDAAPTICGLVMLRRIARRSGVTTASFIYPDREWQTDLPDRSIACVLELAFETLDVDRLEVRARATAEIRTKRETVSSVG